MCKYEFSGWDTLIASSSFWLKTPIVSLRPFLVNKSHDVRCGSKTKQHGAVLRTAPRPFPRPQHLRHQPRPKQPRTPGHWHNEVQRGDLHKRLCNKNKRSVSVSTLYSSEPCKSCFSLASNCVNRRVILSIRACKSLYSLYSALKSFL